LDPDLSSLLREPYDKTTKQPGRELAYSNAATRAKDATLSVSRIAQSFLSARTSVCNTFDIRRHLITSATKCQFHTEAFETWRAAVGVAARNGTPSAIGPAEPAT